MRTALTAPTVLVASLAHADLKALQAQLVAKVIVAYAASLVLLVLSEGVSIVEFSRRDVVRHPLVARIVDAYDAQRSPRTAVRS